MLKNKSQLSDLELIQNIKEKQCSDSFEVLVDRYQKVYYDCCQKFHRRYQESSLDDLLSDIYIVFNQVVNSFKEEKKVKFSTWLSYMSRFHCLNTNKNHGLTKTYENKDIDLINQNQNKYQNFEHNVNDLNNHVFSILEEMDDKRIPTIYKLRYMEGGNGNKLTSWQEIAPKVNLSISGAILLHQKGKKYLYNRLQGQNEYN